MNWYIRVLEKYAVFSGRARRKEYWMFALFNFIFSLVASLLQLAIFGMALWEFNPLSIVYGVIGGFIIPVVYVVYAIAVFVPTLAVSVRRLHDIGKSGWYLLINLIPIAGPIWFLVLVCSDSQPGNNEYGPNPKAEEESGKAIADYNKAIELDPNHALAYSNRGCAYGEIGAYDKAIADYNKAIELNPNDSLAYYNRGLAYSEKGDVPKAVSDLEKCIGLCTDPELTKDAQQALSEIKNSS